MKKVVCLLLTLGFLISFSLPAFAESVSFPSSSVYEVLSQFDTGNKNIQIPVDLNAVPSSYKSKFDTIWQYTSRSTWIIIYCFSSSNTNITCYFVSKNYYKYYTDSSSGVDTVTFCDKRLQGMNVAISYFFLSYNSSTGFYEPRSASNTAAQCNIYDSRYPSNYCYIYNNPVSSLDSRVKILDVSSIKLVDSKTYTKKYNLTVNYLYSDNTAAFDSVSQAFEPGAEYNISSPQLEGYTCNLLTVSGTMPEKNLTIDVIYTKIPTVRNLTINYLYTDNTPAAESVTYPFEPGEEFSIPSPEIPGYLPNRSVISGTMPDEDASIDVFYSQLFYPLTIKYQYVDGTQAAADAVENHPMGFEYSVPSPEISGYTPNRAMVSGTMPAQAVTETVVYVGKPYTLTVIYQYENGMQATDTYQGRFITGSHYSVPSPKLEGYSPSVETVTGTMPGNDVTLTVIYKVDSGGSTGAGGTGPGGGGESGGKDEPSGGEFTGKDPFVMPEIPSFSGKDPFSFSGLPSFLGSNPFVLPGIPSLSGKDPFTLSDSFSFSGNDPFILPDIPSSDNITAPETPPFSGRDPFRVYTLPPYSYDPFKKSDQ